MKFTQAQLGMIGAQSTRWPPADAGAPWAALHAVVEASVAAVIAADKAISAVEVNRDLSDVARIRKVGETGKAALENLLQSDTAALAAATTAVERHIADIDKGRKATAERKPGPATNEDVVSAEVRAHIAKQAVPLGWALKHRSDPSVWRAVMSAPSFLSGLTDAEKASFAGAAASSIWPTETAQRAEVEKALQVAQLAVRQAERLIFERASSGLLKVSDGRYAVKVPSAAAA